MTLVLFSLHLKVLAHLIVSQEAYLKTSANVKGTLETFTATHFGTTYMISQLPPLLQPPMPICQNTVLNWDCRWNSCPQTGNCQWNTIINFDKPSRVSRMRGHIIDTVLKCRHSTNFDPMTNLSILLPDFSTSEILDLKSSKYLVLNTSNLRLPWNLPHLPGWHVAKHPLSSWSMASSSPGEIVNHLHLHLSSLKSHCRTSLHYLLLMNWI